MTANTEIIKMNFSSAKILVVGDVMLDQYWHGGTSRISPEAPVPVVKIKNTDNRPGGAANVAANLVALGCQVKLLGAVGRDNAAETLSNLLHAKKIIHELVALNDFSTIVKLRVLCRNQQMIRLDHEDDLEDITLEQLKAIYDVFATEISQYNTLVLSDYAKGVLNNPRPYIEVANAFGIPVIVDPKNYDFNVYRGAHIVKPNLSEFERIVGKCESLDILEERARNLITECDIENLVITRGGDGVSIITKDKPVTHLSATSSEVYDVTGAGDTVIAVLAAALSADLDIVKAANLSMVAAGIAVSKVGTTSVSLQELKQEMNKPQELPLGPMKPEELRDVIKQSQARGERVVLVNGCFDLLHYGHILYLADAKALGDRLVVIINSDESVRRLKGPTRPMYDEQHRMGVLAALKAVDWVTVFDENTPGKMVEFLNPDIRAISNERFKSIEDIPPGEGVEHVLSNGGKVFLLNVERVEGRSSSHMIEVLSSETNTETASD
jgi:D-beta-D-heptose 7-phosphate kinase/D-beta-D-heptose 1-phosphate adenosyltransferase